MSFLDSITGNDKKPIKQGVLSGKKVAILATDGFEQSELFDPKDILEDAGAEVKIVSPLHGSIKAWDKKDWGKKIDVDVILESADANDFDALMLPGGVMNPDALRMLPIAVSFVRQFVEAGKPIAAICHGPQILIDVDAAIRGRSPGAVGMNPSILSDEDGVSFLRGRTLTSYASIKTDLMNAGAVWVDKEVVCDNGLITSRKPADIPAFSAKMIEEFAEGVHDRDLDVDVDESRGRTRADLSEPFDHSRLGRDTGSLSEDQFRSEVGFGHETGIGHARSGIPKPVKRAGVKGLDIAPETPPSNL